MNAVRASADRVPKSDAGHPGIDGVRLRFFGFRLPEHLALRTAIGISMDFVLRQHRVQPGTPQAAKLEQNYYQFFLERRLSPFTPPCDLLSPEAARWLDDPRLTRFVIPCSEDDAELRRLVEHLREHDWLKKGFFYVWDEPQTEADFEQLSRRARRIRAIEPQAAIMVPFTNPVTTTKCEPSDLGIAAGEDHAGPDEEGGRVREREADAAGPREIGAFYELPQPSTHGEVSHQLSVHHRVEIFAVR